ncbi:hypothetical protein [Neisseria meningitidis]|uniref:hypothetical protein n=3 Tax=Neisseria meningitidis TaxID=487 RepID=UPI000A6BE384|nr:hypothetical protein [Neisseria meningitidis]MCV6783862.1 hypothetical protein [Neisseria meningitidis]
MPDGLYSGLTKIRTRRRAADSTDSTEPIHLVLQHLRESFSFLFIRYIVLKHRPKPDIVRSCNIIENLSFLIS